jgi:hypothetical protein
MVRPGVETDAPVLERASPGRPRPREEPPGGGITRRALALGFLLVPANTYWVVQSEVIRYAAHPTTTSLFFNVVFCVCALAALNALLRRVRPRWAFSQGELLVVWIILSLGTAMAGHDMLEVLVSTISYAHRFATPENRWRALFFGALPERLMVTDADALRAMWYGGGSLYSPGNLRAWAGPVALWTLFFGLMLWVMLCLNTLFRKQWAENERLTFPLVELPLRITEEDGGIFRSRLMWLGFALAGGIDLLNTAAMSFPSLPHVPAREINLQQYLVDYPWSAAGSVPLQLLPFVVGIGYLLPLDLLFSAWAFYFFWKAQAVLTAAWGLNDGRPQFPYIQEQSAGAYLGVAVTVLWLARRHLAEVLRKALGRPSELDDSAEPLPYRTAVLGIVGGVAALAAFLIWNGVTPWVAAAFFGIYLLLALSITRMRAELGSPAHDLRWTGPDHLLPVLFGPRELSKPTLAFLSIAWGFNRNYRTHPMPHQLEGMRMAGARGIRLQPLVWVMLAAGVWGTLCGFWSLLDAYYRVGAATAHVQVPGVPQVFGREAWQRMARWVTPPGPLRDPLQTWALVAGLGFSLFLTAMRGSFVWWPLHPVGFAVSSSWAMGYMWFPLLVAWLLKLGILRGAGLTGYRKALPFFLGLILGEFVVGSVCNLAGLLFGFELYRFWG